MIDPIWQKFVCKNKYREFRGYVFMHNKPTVVKDKATIAALSKHPDFAAYMEVPVEPQREILKVPERKKRFVAF